MSNLSSRPYHAFFSYSHKDRDIALRLQNWLTEVAGFYIWFDENHLEVGSPVATKITEQMSDCRNWIFLASKNSLASAWVAAERDQALHFNAENNNFRLIILRIDDCQLNQSCPSLARFKWLEVPGGVLYPVLAREVIDQLDGRLWSGRQTGLHDIYVSRGWRPTDRSFADAVCEGLCARKWSLRLIGDAPDQTTFSHDRIREILSGCCGHLVILPHRASSNNIPTDEDYRYFTREIVISADLGVPTVLLAEAETPLPASLAPSVCRLMARENYRDSWSADPPEWLERFIEELKEPQTPQHLFLAAEFKENIERVKRLRELIEAVTGLPCQIGRDFEGQGLNNKIVSSIVSASIVIANLTSFEKSEPNVDGVNLTNFEKSVPDTADVNINTCVEAGIALGASNTRFLIGKKSLPVFLTAQKKSPNEKDKTKRLPFMLRDSQITWYSDEAELFGHCRRLLHPYRRRIMNYEFTKFV